MKPEPLTKEYPPHYIQAMDDPDNKKLPFDIDEMVSRLREAVKPYPPAAMFALAREGYDTLFEQLVGCIVSIRTRDEATVPICRRVFARARTPEEFAALSEDDLAELIFPSSFNEGKARQLAAISRIAVEKFNGSLPADENTLLALPGVGPKCAHLALGVACGMPFISVDIHVHRVTNRWGYVNASTPEKTETQLSALLPEQYRVEINSLLVPFGKHICTGTFPRCSRCPLLEYCRQAGVTKHG